jgi:hypothetical protein
MGGSRTGGEEPDPVARRHTYAHPHKVLWNERGAAQLGVNTILPLPRVQGLTRPEFLLMRLSDSGRSPPLE